MSCMMTLRARRRRSALSARFRRSNWLLVIAYAAVVISG